MDRRELLKSLAAGAAGAAAFAAGARAEGDPRGTIPPPRNWDDPTTVLYPDPAFEVFDKRFARYNAGTTSLERLWTGAVWTEGPVWFGDWHSLLFSDIPNNRILRYDIMTRDVTLFRYPSHYTNGNTRDRQGRLVSCEQGTRRVTRTEFDGSITVIADSYEGKRLNSPNGVIVKSDDTVWFTDPTYGINGDHEGNRAEAELPRNVYRFDPKSGKLSVVAGDFSMPNGLCFSPDEKKLYVSDTGILGGPAPQHTLVRVFDVDENGRLSNDRVFHDFRDDGTYIADDMRVDEDGNLWCAGGWGPPEMNGVRVFAPDGTPIGAIWTPEVAGNLCFGGHHKNRLFIAASKSIYAIDVNTRGVEL